MNDIAQIIDRVGSSELARLVGVSKQMVSHWRVGRYRPTAEMAVKIERATKGAVTRADIRPDLWPPISAQRPAPTEARAA